MDYFTDTHSSDCFHMDFILSHDQLVLGTYINVAVLPSHYPDILSSSVQPSCVASPHAA